jgi:hypothetical protein
MERGQPLIEVFTFELPQGSSRTMEYPDGELWTFNKDEAIAYGQLKNYLVIVNGYTFNDSEVFEDFADEGQEVDGDDDYDD